MEAEEKAYRDRLADIRASLTGGVDGGFRLIETRFDLENECDARRRLQEEAQQHRDWRERQSRSPFVVALIDGDADEYVLREFVIGFNNRGRFFDFVDVGPERERADAKIRVPDVSISSSRAATILAKPPF
ncbi:ccch zinc finger protein [Colletotrichum scovillei]|nr:ccch zinc finger protein [Colletotrichum scovillei]